MYSLLNAQPIGFYLFFFILGTLIGSFSNVVIYRLPKKQGLALPPSRCINCQKKIPWYDNIPVISCLILRAKCRACGKSFGYRYFLVELLSGFLFAGVFYFDSWSWNLLEHLIFLQTLLICSFIDIELFILPDELTLSGIVIGLFGSILNPSRAMLDSIFGILMGGGFLWLMAYLYYAFTKREGMGGGDIKLLAWIGAVLGWKAIPFVIFFSAIVGSILGLALAWKERKGLKTVIPYGPYLAVAALVYVCGGEALANAYFSLFLVID